MFLESNDNLDDIQNTRGQLNFGNLRREIFYRFRETGFIFICRSWRLLQRDIILTIN